MEQVKTFYAGHESFSIPNLEREINDWLKENPDNHVLEIAAGTMPGFGTDALHAGGCLVIIRYETPRSSK